MNDNSISVTVVIPIYNAEKHIEECVDSLINQTYKKNVEYLFINDGSTDQSMTILNTILTHCTSELPTVRIIDNHENKGVTAVRKQGIKEARGEYVAWIDSDDWIDPTWLEDFINGSDGGKYDIVIQGVTREVFSNASHEKEVRIYSPVDTPQEAVRLFWKEKHMPRALYCQMSRRAYLLNAMNNVSKVNFGEDTFALIYLFLSCNTANWVEKSSYHYRKVENGNSLTTKKFQTKEEWILQKRNIEKLSEHLDSLSDKNDYYVTLNYIKWYWKREFKCIFSYPYEYWHEYKECYNDINIFCDIKGTFSRIITWICSNCYFLFLLRLKIKRGNAFYRFI